MFDQRKKFRSITKCDGISTNCDGLVYYKVRWTVITNWDSFFITKCDMVYYKLQQALQSTMDLLQIATGITKSDDYSKLLQCNCKTLLCKGQKPDFILYIFNNTARCKRAFQSKTTF